MLGIVSSAIITGKFWLKLDVMLYAGIGFLVVASVWNSLTFKRRTVREEYCTDC